MQPVSQRLLWILFQSQTPETGNRMKRQMKWLWPVVMLAILSELLWTASAQDDALPTSEAPKPGTPKPETPKPEEPKSEAPKPEEPKSEAPKPEEPKSEEPKSEAPKPVPTQTQTESHGSVLMPALSLISIVSSLCIFFVSQHQF